MKIVLVTTFVLDGKPQASKELDVTTNTGFAKIVHFVASVPIMEPINVVELFSLWERLINYGHDVYNGIDTRLGYGFTKQNIFFERYARLEARP